MSVVTSEKLHFFHIPVMGTGFSVDSPIRLGHFGISAVISIMDDILCEQIRKYYSELNGLPYEKITGRHPEMRKKRITAYLNMVDILVKRNLEKIKALPFVSGNDKTKYFEMLPEESPLKQDYLKFLKMAEGSEKNKLAQVLTSRMKAGTIDCNIMTKVDRTPRDPQGNPYPAELSDGKMVLAGFAESTIEGDIVFSAGINTTLYGQMEKYPDFYRDDNGKVKKGVIIKVSDYRSSIVQGKFLAKKGIEVKEFRIESGLNCGGHAFASDGFLMGPIIQEFKDNRENYSHTFEAAIAEYYEKKGKKYHPSGKNRHILITAQGGIGNYGENLRLMKGYGLDAVGWASPFLLVKEATNLDQPTRTKLAKATEKDFYLSEVSPLGVVFNSIRDTDSQRWHASETDRGSPGSPCPKSFLVSNKEFTEAPVCTASKQFQKLKLESLGYQTPPKFSESEKKLEIFDVYKKACLCEHLANGALINLGIIKASEPSTVCPGPNLAYFDREYSLQELIDHIYGRGKSLVPSSRPHMFTKDLFMYVDYFEKLVSRFTAKDEKEFKFLTVYKENMNDGIAYYRDFLNKEKPFDGENFESLKNALDEQQNRLNKLYESVVHKIKQEHHMAHEVVSL